VEEVVGVGLDCQSLLVRKDRQDNRLERLNSQQANGQHLAVGQDVKVGNHDFPKVVDSRYVHYCCLHKPAHCKCVNLR